MIKTIRSPIPVVWPRGRKPFPVEFECDSSLIDRRICIHEFCSFDHIGCKLDVFRCISVNRK